AEAESDHGKVAVVVQRPDAAGVVGAAEVDSHEVGHVQARRDVDLRGVQHQVGSADVEPRRTNGCAGLQAPGPVGLDIPVEVGGAPQQGQVRSDGQVVVVDVQGGAHQGEACNGQVRGAVDIDGVARPALEQLAVEIDVGGDDRLQVQV